MGKDIGLFIARTTFFSSALHLNCKRFRDKISFWNGNNQMCELTEQVIFSDPYLPNAQNNKWNKPFLDEIVSQFQTQDNNLIIEIA